MTPAQQHVWEQAIEVIRKHWKHAPKCGTLYGGTLRGICNCGKRAFVVKMRVVLNVDRSDVEA